MASQSDRKRSVEEEDESESDEKKLKAEGLLYL